MLNTEVHRYREQVFVESSVINEAPISKFLHSRRFREHYGRGGGGIVRNRDWVGLLQNNIFLDMTGQMHSWSHIS